MAHDIKFDNIADIVGAVGFKGGSADYYAEELVVGPRASRKFRRLAADKDIADITLDKLGSVESGHSVIFGNQGVEVTVDEFDGRKTAELFKISYEEMNIWICWKQCGRCSM